ncbi:DUF6999 family protein [Parazoarcus communis]|uniref:Uncharacterized protein n=1 Tax=Parazoarcus communis SWub3 = DSM 12120 TaxID=1121029 RepID=A0A323USZ9_9RHOO|nr:hypothetical protein [Parazoarcus communis]NMG71684.1 hypothetical protein [Parazoarcus communis SWub3 = DSM 12120]PZA14780.1 hypothetical protein DNK49_20070 [Azoarcus communis] [Parazoarcus communis SWub3 = DSM 12120]
MKPAPDFLTHPHDPRDPSPWLALYLDQSTPLDDTVKAAWLKDSSSRSRQFVLPFVRPLARTLIVLIQIVKLLLPKRWAASRALHYLLAESMKRFVSPEANWLVLRHFTLGAQILEFIARNSPIPVETSPITPVALDELKDELFLKHDLNLFNFVIRLNQALRDHGRQLETVSEPDFSMITEPAVRLDAMPDKALNFMDLQTAIECFTPIYQLFLTDNDFWRATNSLQLDETIGIYAATILGAPQHLILLNNKHPLVPMSTLRAGYRLVLHGLSTEMLHALLMRMKAAQAGAPLPKG